MIAWLSIAMAGSISLNVETDDARGVVDFGSVSVRSGGAMVGRRVQTEDGSFLVLPVTATATWQGNEPVALRTERRRLAGPGPMMATMRASPMMSLLAVDMDPSDKSPPTTIDLYVQTTRERGDAQVWVGPQGTNWAAGAGSPVSQLPTLVSANIPLDTPHRHELALEITRWTEGEQQKEIVYTAIIP